jgi:hypothetical protein
MSGFSSEPFIERWHKLSLMEQLGNIGSEVERIISWKKRGNNDLATKALDRSLELLDLTICDLRWRGGTLKELTRTREILCDAFVGDNVYNTPHEFLSRYFYAFAAAAQRKNGK